MTFSNTSTKILSLDLPDTENNLNLLVGNGGIFTYLPCMTVMMVKTFSLCSGPLATIYCNLSTNTTEKGLRL